MSTTTPTGSAAADAQGKTPRTRGSSHSWRGRTPATGHQTSGLRTPADQGANPWGVAS
ncbi:TPA: hypothetical protein L2X43_005144 [Escherichia coli]|nr:hypothetical protein [Escherichia coli]